MWSWAGGPSLHRQRALLDQIDDLTDGQSDTPHEGAVEAGERASYPAAVVDGSELVDQQIGVPAQSSAGGARTRRGSASSVGLVVSGMMTVEGC